MVQRWTFYDPVQVETYTFPYNPQAMGSIFRPRNIKPRTTTAVDGQSLVSEGNAPPHQWKFSGVTRDHAHYAALEDWCNRPNRITLTDHFGRSFDVALQDFDAKPVRKVSDGQLIYWYHDFVVTALILTTPTAATVGV